MFDETLEKLYTWKRENTPLEYQGRPAKLLDLEFFQRIATVSIMNLDGTYSPTTMHYDDAANKLHKRD